MGADGEKYGKPTSMELSRPSSPMKGGGGDSENAEDNDNDNEEDEEEESKLNVRYNPDVKAMTECDARSSQNGDQLRMSPISKSQRRRARKKNANAKKGGVAAGSGGKSKQSKKSMMTADNLLAFDMTLDGNNNGGDDKERGSKDGSAVMADLKLGGVANDATSEKSDIEKMVEEDLTTTFDETQSILSELSAHSNQLSAQRQSMQNRLAAAAGSGGTGYGQYAQHVPPRFQNSRSLPISAAFGQHGQAPALQTQHSADSVSFGTLFTGGQGAIFGGGGGAESQSQAQSQGQQQEQGQQGQQGQPPPLTQSALQPNMMGGGALPPLHQNQTSEPVKMTVADAWSNGDWLTPENLKKGGNGSNKNKKSKLEQTGGSNQDSSVAVITVDLAMQKAMLDMGLRVLSTQSNRQYGNGGGPNGQNEPARFVFRCYGCFQFEQNTNRTHCRYCGGQTYQRVAIYVDASGKEHYRYFYRDRYAHKYLDKHGLVPRGSQLVKYNQQNGRGNNNKKKKKKRGYLNQGNYNSHNSRGGGGRW